ncbi:MerR family transcriptional regulator [Bacillus sp. FJAT-49705]|uniref:MerR family transcriptional regulator n=1 Tax=Cytobacillus citreus TaxID=2833586 RepID=A0ABS5NQ95_9BACI|nr:MerR family transcriptional regulator [Cytobacillus citreus]MBS4190000.1 MerR family transcriptional regulator [Cytobacillus citreus]
MAANYSIGQFSKKTSTTIRTLRYYDEIGILKPAFITESGRRYYSDNDLIKLQKIVSLKYLGYSLEKITEFIHMNDWNLKESLSFQRKEMLQKKLHIEKVIRALDHALHIMDDDGEVDSSIFISLILNIQMESEHKKWLKGFIEEKKVDAMYDIPEEKQLELNKKAITIYSDLKNLYGHDPESNQVQEVIKGYMEIVQEIIGDDFKLVQELYDMGNESESQIDTHNLFHSPFTPEEEEWVTKAMDIYLRKKGVIVDGK